MVLFLLVIFRYFSTRPIFRDGDLIRVASRVSAEPVQYTNARRLILAGLKIYLPKYPEVGYGDRVVIEGVVAGGQLKKPRLISVEREGGILFRLRQRLIAFYRFVLPEPHASLVAGIVLGSKSQISESFWQSLKNSGAAHVVVASGMNVTFVAGFLIAVLALYLPRKKALIPAVIGIWLYAVLSGFEAPIIRAAAMTTLAFWAQAVGKVSFAWEILLFSALVMLAVKPSWLNDTGFILTYVATSSLMLFSGRIKRLFGFLPKATVFFNEGLITSLAAQIGVAPILFVTFGQFNLFSPLINALILWTVPLIMIIGAIGGIVGLVVPVVGRLILLIVYPLTWWFTMIISI